MKQRPIIPEIPPEEQTPSVQDLLGLTGQLIERVQQLEDEELVLLKDQNNLLKEKINLLRGEINILKGEKSVRSLRAANWIRKRTPTQALTIQVLKNALALTKGERQKS